MYIYNKVMTQAIICSICKKHYDSFHNEKPKVIIKPAKIVKRREEVEKNNNH